LQARVTFQLMLNFGIVVVSLHSEMVLVAGR
jgi:hypothetical protein